MTDSPKTGDWAQTKFVFLLGQVFRQYASNEPRPLHKVMSISVVKPKMPKYGNLTVNHKTLKKNRFFGLRCRTQIWNFHHETLHFKRFQMFWCWCLSHASSKPLNTNQ